MSQPKSNKNKRTGAQNRSGAPGGRPQGVGGAGRGQVGRAQPEQGSFRSRVDQALPPFSVKRYVAIWLLGMIPLIAVLLILLRPGSATQSPPAVTLTPGSNQYGELQTGTGTPAAGGGGGAEATVTTSTGESTPAPALATATGGETTGGGTTEGGRFFVIETSKGRIVARMHTDASAAVANTIANFEKKAQEGYFNNLTFHRVEEWVVQGGDPVGNGTGGGDMPSEYNNLPFVRGALGVARGQDPTINNDSQFFIVKTDATWLNGQYTNWGQVVEGMEIVDQIAIGDKITKISVEER